MRITNNMMISNMVRNLGNNTQRLSKYQNQLDTGKKISVPSDDPVVAARALKLRTDVAKVEQYQKNIGDAQSWLEATDVALGKIGDVMQKARELMVQASNGTNTPEETQKIGLELKQLRTQVVHLSNSTYAGRYIFSGFKTDQKLVNDDENSPDFGNFNLNVDSVGDRIKYEIGVGDSININIAGGDLLNNGGNAYSPGSGVSTSKIDDIKYPFVIDGTNSSLNLSVNGTAAAVNIAAGTYNDVSSLEAAIKSAVDTAIAPSSGIEVNIENNRIEFATTTKTATSAITLDATPGSFLTSLNAVKVAETSGAVGDTPALIKMFNEVIACMDAGDYKGISDRLASMDTQIGNVLRCRADVGARQNRVDLTADRMENDLVNFTDLMSKNEDVDVAETIMNLKNEENVYQASLAGGARIIQQTLVDFLR